MSSISSEDIISILKEEIKNYDDRCRGEETGTVISVGDGIARIYGMDQAMYGEILLFENGLKGMVQDIKEDSIGCILFGKDTAKEAVCTGRREKQESQWERRLWGA